MNAPRPEYPAEPLYLRGQEVEYLYRGKVVKGTIKRIEAVWHSFEAPYSPAEVIFEVSHPHVRHERVRVKAKDIRTPTYVDEMRAGKRV